MHFAKRLCATVALLLTIVAINAQDTTLRHLRTLHQSSDPKDKIILRERLQKAASSGKEMPMMAAANMYYQIGHQDTAELLQKKILLKFPLGVIARGNAADTVYQDKNAEAAEKKYNAWVKKFPPSRFPNVDHDHIVYDYARSHVAQLYAEAGKAEKAKRFIGMLEEEFWKGNGYAGLAETFKNKGDLNTAVVYQKKAVESARQFLDATDGAGRFAASGYPSLITSYAGMLFQQKNYAEALKYIDTAYRMNKSINPATNHLYARILMADNQPAAAFEKMDEVMKTGKASSEMRATFKEVFAAAKGSEQEYNLYMKTIDSISTARLNKKLKEELISKPAPAFTLNDLSGKPVSLDQFRGKIVILDFWATWCGPCKKSFPAMQKAVDQYKTDSSVQFLFIHTWERNEKASQEAQSFITENNYRFDVLMDLKDPATKRNNVVTDYNVKGIPAKFIIDAAGNIRFALTGFDGSDEEAVNEISSMIEMIRKAS